MALLPPFGPKLAVVIRRQLILRAMAGDSFARHAVAIMIGRSRPLRSRMIRRGLSSSSTPQRLFAGLLIAGDIYRSQVKKTPEPLGSWTVASNSFVNVINAKPMSKKQRKQMGITKKAMRGAIIAQAVADTRAANPDAKIVVKTK